MSDQARKFVCQPTVRRGLNAFVLVVLIALTGCFGPHYMRDDVQDYNKAVVASEEQMLLFNIGRLYSDQPPHFMMLSSVSQSRTFSTGASLQWGQLWNSLASPFAAVGNVKNTDAITAGPFTAAVNENPTITFVPVQGQDFAQRFESPLTDKFTLFLEDREWYGTAAEKEALVLLFAQSLVLWHGDNEKCKTGSSGFFVNRDPLPEDLHPDTHYYSDLSSCVKEIVEQTVLNSVLIDSSYPVPTGSSEGPKAADLVTALGAGYEFPRDGDKGGVLATPVRIPAWFDYDPKFVSPRPKHPSSPDQRSPVWWSQPDKPDWDRLAYKLPKDYQWKENKDAPKGDPYKYALVPEGYRLERDKNGNYELAKPKEDEAKKEEQFSYADEVVRDVWPVTKNYLYLELRRGKADDATAERLCHSQPDKNDKGNLVCGYFKIGNLLQIMQRVSKMACTDKRRERVPDCQQSFFGIGSKEEIPKWADRWTSYTYQTKAGGEETKWVWVPAHNPNGNQSDAEQAEQDRREFLTLYKLYQMSLVDTSKLVTGAPPITISK